MESFWQIVSKWDAFVQLLFFLSVMGTVLTVANLVVFYLSVMCKGWPPVHFKPWWVKVFDE